MSHRYTINGRPIPGMTRERELELDQLTRQRKVHGQACNLVVAALQGGHSLKPDLWPDAQALAASMVDAAPRDPDWMVELMDGPQLVGVPGGRLVGLPGVDGFGEGDEQ